MTFGWLEISIIVLLIILLFGATRLPNAARSLGRSMRIFKSEMDEMKNDKNAAGQPAEQQAIMPQQPSAQNFGQQPMGQQQSYAEQPAQPQGYATPAGNVGQPQGYGQQTGAHNPMAPQAPHAPQAPQAHPHDPQAPQPGA